MTSDCPTYHAADASEIATLEGLWNDLYAHQQQHGLLVDLAADGFTRWCDGIVRLLGRFSCVFLAQRQGQTIGFVAGRMRTPTPPFAPFPVGFISEVYVVPEERGRGTGRALIRHAIEWFQSQQIQRVELQVLVSNRDACAAYQRAGWQPELMQMVWQIPS